MCLFVSVCLKPKSDRPGRPNHGSSLLLCLELCGSKFIMGEKLGKTSNAEQSLTWGLPAPQVRVESQIRYSKFLSQQSPLANDSENYTLELRGVWSCVSLQYMSCTVVPTLSPLPRDTSSRKVSWGYPTSPEVIWAHTLNFRPNFKFSTLNVFVWTPSPVGVS